MCFSANASFAASAVIGAISIGAIVKTKTIPQRLLASIPLLFSLQQLTEGLLWLSLHRPGLAAWRPHFTSGYLVFATVVWPFWIPLTIWLLEKNAQRKKVLILFTALGTSVAVAVIGIQLLFPVRVIPLQHHLHYQFEFPTSVQNLIGVFTVLYILATIITPFISTFKRIKWLGAGFLTAYIVTLFLFPGSVVSVWCYFAALLSIGVLWILSEVTQPFRVL